MKPPTLPTELMAATPVAAALPCTGDAVTPSFRGMGHGAPESWEPYTL